jgi:hypothetical protein
MSTSGNDTTRRRWNTVPIVVDLTLPTPMLQDHATGAQAIPLDTPEWVDWLAGQTSTTIHVRHAAGNYTARYNRRGGKFYWFAFRSIHGRLRCLYLGRTSELTAARLDAVATAFKAQATSD